jgi:hypothetical protein
MPAACPCKRPMGTLRITRQGWYRSDNICELQRPGSSKSRRHDLSGCAESQTIPAAASRLIEGDELRCSSDADRKLSARLIDRHRGPRPRGLLLPASPSSRNSQPYPQEVGTTRASGRCRTIARRCLDGAIEARSSVALLGMSERSSRARRRWRPRCRPMKDVPPTADASPRPAALRHRRELWTALQSLKGPREEGSLRIARNHAHVECIVLHDSRRVS